MVNQSINEPDKFSNYCFFLSFFPIKSFSLTEEQINFELKFFHIFSLPNIFIWKGISCDFEDSNGETILFQLIKSKENFIKM
jgi:uncharacterized protein YfkK (UPF0435 family)